MMFALTGCGGDVKLCEYTGVEATKVVYEVTDEEVQENILESMYDYADYDSITDRGAMAGDYVVIDYKATMDGKEAEDYSGEEEEILVGGEYIYPEVDEALVGMKAGDRKTVEFVLTAEFANEGDIGKEISMDITVKEITEEVLPEYNEEFVKENTDFETMKDYEANVKENLALGKEEEYKTATVQEILDYVIANSTFGKYPKDLYEKCEKAVNDYYESYAAMFGMETAEFMEMNGVDEKGKKDEIENMVRQELVVSAIAKKEKITCTDEEAEAYVEENYEDWGYEDKKQFFEENTIEDIKEELIYQKVADFLYQNAKYKEISEEEYMEAVYGEDAESEEVEETEGSDDSAEDELLSPEMLDDLDINLEESNSEE